jgi:hypothetical protein
MNGDKDDASSGLRGYIMGQEGNELVIWFDGARGSFNLGDKIFVTVHVSGDAEALQNLISTGFRSAKIISSEERLTRNLHWT